MNYIHEINEFYDWMETHNGISKNAIGLWYALLHINNKAKWARSFTTSMGVLEQKTRIKSSELFKARLELEERGLIRWNQRPGRQSAVYSMYSISQIAAAERAAADSFDKPSGDENGNASGNANGNENGNASGNANGNANGDTTGNANGDTTGESNGRQPVSINKQNETKENETKGNEGDITLLPSLAVDDAEKNVDEVVLKIFDVYNRHCVKLTPVHLLIDPRKQNVMDRLKEYGEAEVHKMLELAAASDFLAGCNDRGWKATFDWLFLPANFAKVLEGNYANYTVNGSKYGQICRSAGDYIGKPSHLQIIEQTYQTLVNDGTFDY